MIQFNLLPDIKLEYLKAQRQRRLVISIALIASLVSVLITGSLFSYTLIQKHQLNNLASDIKQKSSTVSSQKNLRDILTIQNQISTLTTLHEQEPQASDLVTYLNQIVPVTANIGSFSIDFNADTITISGSADSLVTINQLVDSFKFATYSILGGATNQQAFSNVVLTSFSIATSQNLPSYTITLNFDPTLFNNSDSITLIVPSKDTTRSELGQPTILFKQTNSTNGN
jgi:Tfp pilus assembly protein PilN